ncbi:MAG: DUF4911 domain-containing protein [Syntrophomonadaceae bacterium]|nr:DUF4911 domain-containing protein [Syntrophomonadaceae bacterium]
MESWLTMIDKEVIKCRVNPIHINILNRIFEGMDGIGIVSTIDPKEGLIRVLVTPDTYDDAMTIIENAPCPVDLSEA